MKIKKPLSIKILQWTYAAISFLLAISSLLNYFLFRGTGQATLIDSQSYPLIIFAISFQLGFIILADSFFRFGVNRRTTLINFSLLTVFILYNLLAILSFLYAS